MTRQLGISTRALAIGMAALTGAFTTAALVFQAIGGPPDVAETLLVSSFALLGLILALRVPGNTLGWLFLAMSIANSFASASASLLYLARDEWGMPNLAKAMAVASSWEWFLFLGGVATFALLLFPDGRLPSPRWRWLARTAAIGIALGCVLLIAMTVADIDTAVSDLEADTLGPLWMNVLLAVSWVLVLICAIGSFASLVVRWRRARGVERQQLKWFLFGALLQLVGIACGFADSEVVNAVGEATIVSLPAAATLAILRFRLYDIDRIISRTVTYGLLTAVLLALYLGGVTLLTAITAPVTRDSPIAVAAATLLAAAAFGPARRRIQAGVDRRFNRARYDAARTAESYRARLRDQLELTAIGDDLVATVRTAIEPTSAVLWLRETSEATR